MKTVEKELYPFDLSINRIKKAWGGWSGKVGEIWSLSGPPHDSLVLNGPLAGSRLTDIVGAFQERLLGKDMELDPREPFPLLLKFIHTAEDTSIEVHPDDAYTLENGLPMIGADKIWYVISASPGSQIYLGFKEKVNNKDIKKAVVEKDLLELVNSVKVKPGELYTIPAGRIHSIGKGVLLFEVRRHSDLVFRLSGSHTKELKSALTFLNFNPIKPTSIPKIKTSHEKNTIEYLALTPHFVLRRLIIKNSFDFSLKGNRFIVYSALRGKGWLRWGFSEIYIYIQPYQSILVPAVPGELFFESEEDLELIEISVPDLAGETSEQMSRAGIKLDRLVALGGEDYGKILKDYLR